MAIARAARGASRDRRRARRRALGATAAAISVTTMLAGCIITGLDLSGYTTTTVDCGAGRLTLETKSGQTFEEATAGLGWAFDDDAVLDFRIVDGVSDSDNLIATGSTTAGAWRSATRFETSITIDRPVLNPFRVLTKGADDRAWNVAGVGGCSDADVLVRARLIEGHTAVDDTLPVFHVRSDVFRPNLGSFDASAIEVGGTAEPTFTIEPLSLLNTLVTYVVTVTGVTRDGSITVDAPAGVVTDIWGATNRSPTSASMMLDTTPPQFAAARNIDAGYAALDATAKVVEFDDPVASDPHLAAPATCSPASGTAFPIGSTTVTCTAVDTLGHTATTNFEVMVAEAPRAPVSLTLTGAATGVEGEAATFSVEAFNSQDELLGTAGGVTVRSSHPADEIDGTRVTFGFDPAAIGGSSTRTITATLDDDPSISATATVEVASTAEAIRIRAPLGAERNDAGTATVAQGDALDFEVEALDAAGVPLGDAGAVVALESSVATDIVDGTTVTFPHASPHTITATVAGAPSFTDSVTVEVIPTTVALGRTGVDAAPLLALGLTLLLTGCAAAWATARRRGGSARERANRPRLPVPPA